MKWEYKVFDLKGETREEREEILGEWGEDEWELITVSNNGAAYFKRPKLSPMTEKVRAAMEGYIGGGGKIG